MMMPANFSAVSENEMTYVMGGSIGEYLMDPMGKAQWKQFSTNLGIVVGNAYLNKFLKNTVGTVFSGVYGSEGHTVLGGFAGELGGIWNKNYVGGTEDDPADTKTKVLTGALGVLNCGLDIVGNLAAIYNLGFGKVKNAAEDTFVKDGKWVF